MVLGIATQLAVQSILYPLDTIKRNLMADSKVITSKRTFHGSLNCAVRIFKELGVSGFYRGFLVNLTRNFAVLYIQFPLFIALKNSSAVSFKYA